MGLKKEHWHTLTNIDLQKLRATCSQCGLVDLYLEGTANKPRCRNRATEHNQTKKLRQRYGITNAYKHTRTDGRCAICKTRKALHIDHDHKTGKVRGKLCHQCNVAIGMAGDSTTVLRNMIRYLEAAKIVAHS